MDIEQFLAARRPIWNRFAQLLAAAEKSPAWEFGPERLRELVLLYRQTCSDLNQVRSLTANPEILDRLNQLTGQAYRYIYRGARKSSVRGALRSFMGTLAPLAFQKEWRSVALCAAALLAGFLFGFVAVLADRGNAVDLVPVQFFHESPRERVEKIEKNPERIAKVEEALLFGAFLYVNNIRVSILAFALGAVTLVGGLLVVFFNGVFLGALAALYLLDGVQTFFLAWVGPHGALELPAIVFGAAAGVCMGRALWMPGVLSTAESVRRTFPAVWRMMIATTLILIAAGLIEGSFSQFSAKTVPYLFKISVAVILFSALTAWLYLPRSSAKELEA